MVPPSPRQRAVCLDRTCRMRRQCACAPRGLARAPSDPMDIDIVILAAGTGTRLGAASGGRPKALVEIHGRSLLARSIDFARALEPRSIVVVAGFEYDRVAAHLRDQRANDVALVENRRYRDGNLESVRRGLARVAGGFLLTNADHVFPPGPAAGRVAAAVDDDVTAFCEFERALDPDEMRVAVGERGDLVRISKVLDRHDGGYIGLTFVPTSRRAAYDAALERTTADHGPSAVAEQALQSLVDVGGRVRTASFDGIVWSEVDTPADLERARRCFVPGEVSQP